MENIVCPLCQRDLGGIVEDHHLIPKTFKGKEKVRIHKICHRTIHSIYTERELEKYYYTIEYLLEREEMQRFVKWIQKKPVEYYSRTHYANCRR